MMIQKAMTFVQNQLTFMQNLGLTYCYFIHSKKILKHKRVNLVVDGVRMRALTTVQPDPIVHIIFPEVDNEFKVMKFLLFSDCFHEILTNKLILLFKY